MLFSIHPQKRFTRVVLDTPMMTFDEAMLRKLAERMLKQSRHQEEMMAAMTSEPYQQMRADLEAIAGISEQTRGSAYDLSDVFERVNGEYFDGAIPRPRLAWSRTLTGRKFGHYDFVHDQVCISSTLDSPSVPPFVIEHVMHHELLHKKLGLRFHGDRQHAHTPEFREEERRFARYDEADEYLKKIGRTVG
jgi:hypothetical protein